MAVYAAHKEGVGDQIPSDQSDVIPTHYESDSAQTNASLTASGHNVALIRHLGGDVSAVAVLGNTAFIGIGPELAVFELHNPGNPGWVEGVVFNVDVEAVTISGTLAYVAAGEAGLRVLDISNPASLNEIGSLESWVMEKYLIEV